MFTNSSQVVNVLFTVWAPAAWTLARNALLGDPCTKADATAGPQPPDHPEQRSSDVRTTRTLIVSLTAALTLAAPATASARALLIDGSTSVFPLMTQLAAAYHKAKHQPTPKVSQGTSDAGVNDVHTGHVDIGDVSRDPIIGSDPKGLVFTKIARDGICIITSPRNPISNLNQQQVQAIFTGNVREWSEVPGSRMTGPIDLVDRIASSGTQDAFQNIFLGPSLKISQSAAAEESNGLVQNKVHVDEHAIGFVSFAFTGGVNVVGYQGIPCTLRNAKSGQYQGVRNFWMVTRGVPRGATAKFISWITSSKNAIARKIIASQWIPIH
ncbi:MAG TPA: substrate-binding domain-containing protein [Solirubrobacteraceae bacterium]|nr:substrate-binding domain-containing protein [Solirubrobacteraceae bacterium]